MNFVENTINYSFTLIFTHFNDFIKVIESFKVV